MNPMRCLVVLAGIVWLAGGCESKPQTGLNSADQSSIGTVRLVIDFQSERSMIELEVDCFSNSTVFSILESAQSAGFLEFKSTGSYGTTFVKSIGGVDNLATAGDNWIYLVNGQLGDKSAAVFEVKPDDQVRWVFGEYDPE